MSDGMADSRQDGNQHRQTLSALADGELDSRAVASACAAWREDGELQAAWRSYHLIGDVLRSEDLASAGARDEKFLSALRDRLAQEPVVLAPTPARPAEAAVAARAASRRGWMAPFAVAAGFMAVAGVLVVTRGAAPGAPAELGSSLTAQVAPADVPAEPTVEISAANADMTLIRDAHLDRYLAAHRQFGGNALSVPGAGLRNAAAMVPER